MSLNINSSSSFNTSTAPPGKIQLEGEMLLKLLFKQENTAVVVSDEHGMVNNWNDGASQIFKYSKEEAIGRHVSFLYSAKEIENKTPEKEFQKVLNKGEAEFTLLLSRKEGEDFYAKCFLFPLKDENQSVTGYIKVIQRLHAPEFSLDTDMFLKEVDHVLTTSLDYSTILREVINLCVPSMADWVYVDQLQKDGSSKRIAVVHADPSKTWLAKETQKFSASPNAFNYPQTKALYQGKSILIPKVTEYIIKNAAQNKDHEQVMKAINPNSLITTPLIARGKTLGSITFMVGESGRTYSKKELKLTEELARRTSLVLDNAVLYEQAQWESNRLQSLFIDAPVAIAIVRVPDYVVELANPPICKIWGRDHKDVLGKPVFEIIPEAEVQGFKMLMDKVATTGEPFIGKEMPVELRKDGKTELLYLNFVYQPISDPEGKVHSIMAVANDVSEQVMSRQKTEENEEKLLIALEAGSMGIWHLDLLHNTSSRSLKHDIIFGYSSLLPQWGLEEFLNHIVPEERETVKEKFVEAYNTGFLFFEARIIRADAELRWITVQGKVFYHQQMATRMAGIVTDITELINARQQAQENAERFRMLLETIPQITWTHKQDGMVTYYNQRWYDYTGLSPEQSESYVWKEVVHPDDLENSVQILSTASKTEQPFEMENRFLRGSDCMYRWHLVRALPLRNEKGEVSLWVGTATDIHDQKMQSSLLKQQNKKLDDINKYLDNFVHAVAHDLRSPVANMIGLLQLLNFSASDIRNINIAEMLKTSVERLDNSLKGMIQLIEAQNESENDVKLISVKETFNHVLKEFNEPLQKIDHSVHGYLEHCPSIRFIQPYMEIIFRHLISNSIKYRRENQPLEITVGCRNENDYLLIFFQDNGIGIDLKKHKKDLFKPFVRFTRQASGKGIGLHIINNMLQRNGGKVEVESSAATGTTFNLYFAKE